MVSSESPRPPWIYTARCVTPTSRDGPPPSGSKTNDNEGDGLKRTRSRAGSHHPKPFDSIPGQGRGSSSGFRPTGKPVGLHNWIPRFATRFIQQDKNKHSNLNRVQA